ncbi:alpha/beta-hydrolase, partial [Nadsonia fulvescens var. elongata DSM 6958]
MYIPFLGRLRVWEWPVLVFSVALVLIEYMVATVTTLLPAPVIRAFDWLTRVLWRWIMGVTMNSRMRAVVASRDGGNPLVDEEPLSSGLDHESTHFEQMCSSYGYSIEEHIVRTQDGYLLGLFRILHRNNTLKATNRPVVYLHHGLLMNSEVWVTNLEKRSCIPLVLADAGYDVWLGNNRGNKYSKKHLKLDSNGRAFWNFCLDEFALFDIPDSINYILSTTEQAQLSYIGFSQGSAQAFAALAVDPQLNKRVNTVIALAPALAPPGLNNRIVDAFMKASPSLFFLIFGHRILLPSATFWQSLVYPPLFIRLIDTSISFLFNWQSLNISQAQRRVSYRHLYSYTSVKSIVHWFQIMRRAQFNMYDDAILGRRESRWSKFYKVASFPTKNIKCPITLIYGTVDSLVDIDLMLSQLPTKPGQVKAVGVTDYEHLDIIWSDNVYKKVMPHILSNL